ncbi:MAG: TPM domain-containing protein [Bacteroidia bacterium]|nr:TPM domain-containing protein [Bacteroidia bacterium]
MAFNFFKPLSETFFSKEEDRDIVEAIQKAEKQTSGEIRIHLESRAKMEVEKRAWKVFHQLEMHKTALRNGVLIYMAIKDHKFAIIGDEGINKLVGEGFWEDTAKILSKAFKEEAFVKGLTDAVLSIGEKLKEHFPYEENDENELPNEISFG